MVDKAVKIMTLRFGFQQPFIGRRTKTDNGCNEDLQNFKQYEKTSAIAQWLSF